MRRLRNYFERRRRAAAVARQRVSHPFFHYNWLQAKLAFDREFRALMRTSYFYKT